MFLLTAIFNAASLDDVLADLKNSNIEGVTISHVSGKGGLGDSLENGKPMLYKNIRLEIVVSSVVFKELAKEAIRSNTPDLATGAGKMWVTPVLEVERIRTGETDKAALEHSKVKKIKHHTQYFYTTENTPLS